MNLRLFKILVLTLLLFSCKTTELKNGELDFKKYIEEAIEKRLIEKDPLILLDAKPIGLLSEIDLKNFEFKTVNSNSIKIIPKGIDYLKKFWGENAKNGIIEISKFITLHCGKPPKRIYLLNGKKVNWEELKKLKPEDLKYWSQIDDVSDSENNDYVIEIVITNKES